MQTAAQQYQCPGESYTIDRPIHLGRLAAFDARCRGCPHRHDTGSLPPRLIEALSASWQQESPPLLDVRGASGILGKGLDSAFAQRQAIAFGSHLQKLVACPSVVLTGDGRSCTAELVAAASEGLRWSGCSVIEVPAATSACLAFTQSQLKADGAMLVGNTAGTLRTASLRCYGPGGHALTGELLRNCGAQNRPSRCYGGWRRATAEGDYLATLACYFHALRPLKFVLDTSCAPLIRYLQQLLRPVACRVYSPAQAKGVMHFTMWIDGDGEQFRLHDETGCEIGPAALRRLLSPPAPDALHALALLLTILSQSDRPLSGIIASGGRSPHC